MMLAFLMVEAENPLEHVVQHPLVQRPANLGFLSPGGMITLMSDQIAMLVLAGLLLILFMPLLVKRRRGMQGTDAMVPIGFGNAIEAICQYLRKEVAEPNLHEHTDRFIKYLWSLFFFILTVNLLGLLPIPAVAKLFHTHLGGAATGNIWVTATLALITGGMMVVNGVRLGGWHYFAHFCPGPLWLAPILVPVELIGLVAKVFSLTVRLFANMLAGHVLLAVMLSFIGMAAAGMGVAGGLGVGIPVVLTSVAISMLEIFVALLQAFIFTFLTALFIGQSVVFHHGGHEDAHAH
jgi:F-type H+-transporting ATPase subunit a